MFFFTLLLVYQDLSITYEYDGPIIQGNLMQIGPQGELLVAHLNSLYKFEKSGTVKELVKEENPITCFYFDGSSYLITSFRPTPKAFIYDIKGTLLASSPQEEPFIDIIHPSNTTEPFVSLYRNPHQIDINPFFINGCHYKWKIIEQNLIISAHPDFMKITKKQHALGYNFRTLWIVQKRNMFYVMNQIEPSVIEFTMDVRDREKRDGTKVPTNYPRNPISLPKYIEPPSKPFGLSRPIKRASYMAVFDHWWNSWSRITWFSEWNDGYVVTYEIPDCDPTKENGCTSTHLGIQKLDQSFITDGPLIETEGKMMGVNPEGQICVFQSNPIEEDGKVVGCRPKILFWDPH